MTTTLYRCLLQERDEAKRVLEAAEEIGAAYATLAVSTRDTAEGTEVRFSSGDAEAVLRVRELDSEDRAALAPYGEFEGAVSFLVHEVTPESAGLCWDALIAASTYHSCTVWISKNSYDERAISHFAPLRPVQFGEESAGFVLQPEEFSSLVDE